MIVDSIREGFPDIDDENRAHFALVVAQVMANLAMMPPRPLAETIDNMFTGYSLAAANLAGMYEIGDDVPRNIPAEEVVNAGDGTPLPGGEWNSDRLYL